MLTFNELKAQMARYSLVWDAANLVDDWRTMRRIGEAKDRVLRLMVRSNRWGI